MLHAIVHPADIQDRDGGYQGPEFQKALTRILPQLKTDIIKRSDQAKGFVVLPRRWIVEQSKVVSTICRTFDQATASVCTTCG